MYNKITLHLFLITGSIILLFNACKENKQEPVAYTPEKPIEVKVPVSVTTDAQPDSAEQLFVHIKRSGILEVSRTGKEKKILKKPFGQSLGGEIQKIKEAQPDFFPNQPAIFLVVDPKTDHTEVQDVITIFRKQNILKFKLLTEE